MNWAKSLLRVRFFAGAATAGLVAALVMPADGLKETGEELIALFGLMMAGVLPTMVLTASVLRPGNMSVRRVTEYGGALQRQLMVWIGLFLISLVACLSVIVGSMLGWKLQVTQDLGKLGVFNFDFIVVLNGFIVACLALVVLRAFAVGRGIQSLLRLNSEIAISEAKSREEQRLKEQRETLSRLPDRTGFGDFVDLKQ